MALEPIQSQHPQGATIEPLCAIFRRALRDEGLKYTPERARILDTIIEIDGIFEAEQLLATLKERGYSVSKATVYRTLKLLETSGIIQQILFDREQSHYQLAMGQRGSTLLIRVDTGEIETAEIPELIALRDKLCKERGLKPEGHRFQIFVTGDDAGEA